MDMHREARDYDRYMGWDEADGEPADCENCGAGSIKCSTCGIWYCDCTPCDCTYIEECSSDQPPQPSPQGAWPLRSSERGEHE